MQTDKFYALHAEMLLNFCKWQLSTVIRTKCVWMSAWKQQFVWNASNHPGGMQFYANTNFARIVIQCVGHYREKFNWIIQQIALLNGAT